MLKTITIRDFAIFREIRLEFGLGLTVVTGETGAGKSMIFDVCALLAGARADAAAVRAGAERAELAAEFDVSQLKAAKAWLKAQEMDDEQALSIRRVIRAEGSSKAWINGRNATSTQLRELATCLLELHGQHESQDLLDPAQQLVILDEFAGLQAELDATALASAELKRLRARMKTLQDATGTSGELVELLRAQYQELQPLKLAGDYLAELDAKQKKLSNVEALTAALSSASQRLSGDAPNSALRLLRQSHHELSKHASLDKRLAEACTLMDSVMIELDECLSLIRDAEEDLELDPSALAKVESELTKLHDIARKHRVMVSQLAERREELKARLTTLDGADVELAKLQNEFTTADQRWLAAAAVLSQRRQHAQKKLSRAVEKLIHDLGMSGGKFDMQIEARASQDRHETGAETGEFLVAANPGQPARAVRKVASGGELSRISLALKVASLRQAKVPVLLFDEVDAGIGGAVADTVGRLLAKLASSHQVIVVTHLAQVSAYGDQHLQVSKSTDGAQTQSQIALLDEAMRIDEIARMLTGVVNAPSKHSAQDLRQRALAAKSAVTPGATDK